MNDEQVLIKQTTIDIAKETAKRFNGINTPEIKMIIDENEELNKKFMEIKSLHKENNMPLSKAAKTYCKSRIDDLYIRCGNTVLKSLSII